jgi:hypothetical protein
VTGNVNGNVAGSVANLLGIATTALAQFFTSNTGETFADAVDGSVVKETVSGGGSGDTSSFSGDAEVKIDNITAQVNKLDSSGTVTIVSPVVDAQQVNIIRNNDYYLIDGRELPFTLRSGPSIIGATVLMRIYRDDPDTPDKFTATITSATTFYIELDRTYTVELTKELYSFDIFIVLSNTHHITPIEGFVIVAGPQQSS